MSALLQILRYLRCYGPAMLRALISRTAKMPSTEDLELQMREALGVVPGRKKTMKDASRPVGGYLVVLSVREASGPAFRFKHRSRSISRTEAILAAEKQAKEQGLLDIEQF